MPHTIFACPSCGTRYPAPPADDGTPFTCRCGASFLPLPFTDRDDTTERTSGGFTLVGLALVLLLILIAGGVGLWTIRIQQHRMALERDRMVQQALEQEAAAKAAAEKAARLSNVADKAQPKTADP